MCLLATQLPLLTPTSSLFLPILQFIPNYYKFYGNKADEKSTGELVKFLQRLEDILKAHKGGFLHGETAGAVDYILWPWFERLGALKILKPGKALVNSTQTQLNGIDS